MARSRRRSPRSSPTPSEVLFDYPSTFAESLAPYAGRYHFKQGDGLGLLRWLLSLVGDPDASRWLHEAEDSVTSAAWQS